MDICLDAATAASLEAEGFTVGDVDADANEVGETEEDLSIGVAGDDQQTADETDVDAVETSEDDTEVEVPAGEMDEVDEE